MRTEVNLLERESACIVSDICVYYACAYVSSIDKVVCEPTSISDSEKGGRQHFGTTAVCLPSVCNVLHRVSLSSLSPRGPAVDSIPFRGQPPSRRTFLLLRVSVLQFLMRAALEERLGGSLSTTPSNPAMERMKALRKQIVENVREVETPMPTGAAASASIHVLPPPENDAHFVPRSKKVKEWRCQECRYINIPTASECLECGLWKCLWCDTRNNHTRLQCRQCQRPHLSLPTSKQPRSRKTTRLTSSELAHLARLRAAAAAHPRSTPRAWVPPGVPPLASASPADVFACPTTVRLASVRLELNDRQQAADSVTSYVKPFDGVAACRLRRTTAATTTTSTGSSTKACRG